MRALKLYLGFFVLTMMFSTLCASEGLESEFEVEYTVTGAPSTNGAPTTIRVREHRYDYPDIYGDFLVHPTVSRKIKVVMHKEYNASVTDVSYSVINFVRPCFADFVWRYANTPNAWQTNTYMTEGSTDGVPESQLQGDGPQTTASYIWKFVPAIELFRFKVDCDCEGNPNVFDTDQHAC